MIVTTVPDDLAWASRPVWNWTRATFATTVRPAGPRPARRVKASAVTPAASASMALAAAVVSRGVRSGASNTIRCWAARLARMEDWTRVWNRPLAPLTAAGRRLGPSPA